MDSRPTALDVQIDAAHLALIAERTARDFADETAHGPSLPDDVRTGCVDLVRFLLALVERLDELDRLAHDGP